MREIQSSAAKARLPQLLDEVERGETIVITRHARAIARLVPEAGQRQEEIAKAPAELDEFRRTMPPLTLAEIFSARHEGPSGTACWLVPDELHATAALTREKLSTDHAIVPRIWWFEIRNLLVVNERRGRLDAEKSDRTLGLLKRLPIKV